MTLPQISGWDRSWPIFGLREKVFSAFELIGSRLSVITAAAFTVFSLPVTARRRVQSGSEWCPDGLETLTVRQTSPATPQLCTLGELWSHPEGIRILPEALQHCGPGWYPLHVQTAEAGGLGPGGACEPGERESWLIVDDQIWLLSFKINLFYLSNRFFLLYSFAKDPAVWVLIRQRGSLRVARLLGPVNTV